MTAPERVAFALLSSAVGYFAAHVVMFAMRAVVIR